MPSPPPGFSRQQQGGPTNASTTGPRQPSTANEQSKRSFQLHVQDIYEAVTGPQANNVALQALPGSATGRSKQASPAELAEGQVLHIC